jgi:hypothetical protein
MKQISFKNLYMRRINLFLWPYSTFRYIDNVLSINNDQFHSYVDSEYPSELEIKDTTESSTSSVLVKIDAGGKLTTQLYDKQGDSICHCQLPIYEGCSEIIETLCLFCFLIDVFG